MQAYVPPRQPDESAKAYAAFVAYAEMGAQRSLDKVRQLYHKKPSYTRILSRWNSRHSWQTRVADYDRAMALERAEVLQATRLADIEQARLASQRDASTLRTLAQALIRSLAARLSTLDADSIAAKDIAPLLRTVASALETATNLEAAALGIADLLALLDDSPQAAQDGPGATERDISDR